jgi:hypothetical protein
MNGKPSPIARRYWFVDSGTLATIDAAVNPPDWGESPVSVNIFCLDEASFVALVPMRENGDGLEVVDARDEGEFGSIFRRYIGKEQAEYVQVTRHAIEDFPASVELIFESLVEDAPLVLASTLLAVSRYQTEFPAGDVPITARASWLATSQIRALFSEPSDLAPASVIESIEAKIADLDIDPLPLVSGAYYQTEQEQLETTAGENDTALWRARAAVSAAQIDNLHSEKRIRAGREAAMRARHSRDLAQQGERTRAEIERLHRAAGWSGRWRARFTRIFGGK